MDEDERWAVYEALHASVHMIAMDQASTLLVMDLQEEALSLIEDDCGIERYIVRFILDGSPGLESKEDLITALEFQVDNERHLLGRFVADSITDAAGNVLMTRDEIWENASAVGDVE